MKKALIVLLILAIAGGVFAQELTWNGAVKTGLEITANDDHNGEDIGVRFENNDVGDQPLRLQLDGAYTNDNWGVVFGIRSDATARLIPSVYQAYGWFSFANGLIKTSAGLIDAGAWGTGGLEDYGVNGTGLRIEIIPITGLNLGLMLRAPDNRFDANIKEFLSETAFGAKYENDLFWVAAAILLDSTADGINANLITPADSPAPIGALPVPAFPQGVPQPDPVTGTWPTWINPASTASFATDPKIVNSDHGLDFRAGAGVKPIPGLQVSVEGRAFNASKMNDFGYFALDEDVSYKLLSDKLTVGLKSYQYFWGSEWSKNVPTGAKFKGDTDLDASLKPYIKLTPYVGYDVIDTVNVGLEATFGFWKDVLDLQFSLKPKVTYNFAEKAKIVAFYNFSSLDYYKDVPSPNATDDRKTDKSNTIQIDLIWEF